MDIDPERVLGGGIFVISMQEAGARRAAIAARLSALQLPFSFFDAVDGRKLDLPGRPDYDRAKRLLFCGRDLLPGEFGCLLSHRGLCEQIVAQGLPAAVVLEDDAIPADDFAAVVRALCRRSVPWDLVRFLGKSKNERLSRPIVPLCGSYTLCRPYGLPGGTYGYLVNAKAAVRLVGLLQHNWLPVDAVHGRAWESGLQVLNVVPSPVRHDHAQASCIENDRWNLALQVTGWKKAAHLFMHWVWRLQMAFWKNYIWLRNWPADARHRARG